MPTSAKGKRHKASPFVGYDGDGRVFQSATEMWRDFAGETGIDAGAVESGSTGDSSASTMAVEGEGPAPQEAAEGGAHSEGKRARWYEEGLNYWKGVEASVEGVLGGYGKVSPIDIDDSKDFLLDIYGGELAAAASAGRATVALDCGAGIGRVSKGLLLPIFNEVDLVEPAPHFLAQAEAELQPSTFPERSSSAGAPSPQHAAKHFFCMPLQDFHPEAGRYDVIWVQWCIGHLTDIDFIRFFKRAQEGIRPGGLIVLKENVCQQGFVLDNADSSVTRSDSYFRSLLQQSSLKLVKSKVQRSFPKELFQVRMYALRPESAAPERRQLRPRNAPKVISV